MSDTINTYQAIRSIGEEVSSISDDISIERPLQILINEEPFTITMCSPSAQKELAVGLLHAEDVISNWENVSLNLNCNVKEDMDHLYISCPDASIRDGFKNARNFLSVSSCGICGKTELQEVNSESLGKINSSTEEIHTAFKVMSAHQKDFQRSGGIHAVAVFNESNEMITIHEDVGRHNAVDKCVGDLLLQNKLSQAKMLAVSGRISYEIIIKAFRAKIPVVAAVSAPTSLAIDFAKELGITLYAFCRENRSTQYA